ncbi:hypothetical protein D3C85_1416310 [compost metagenome]
MVPRLQGEDLAVAAECAVWIVALDVLDVHQSAEGFRVVVLGHLIDPAGLDDAAVGRAALDGDAEVAGLLGGFVGHGAGSLA